MFVPLPLQRSWPFIPIHAHCTQDLERLKRHNKSWLVQCIKLISHFSYLVLILPHFLQVCNFYKETFSSYQIVTTAAWCSSVWTLLTALFACAVTKNRWLKQQMGKRWKKKLEFLLDTVWVTQRFWAFTGCHPPLTVQTVWWLLYKAALLASTCFSRQRHFQRA